MDTSSHTHRFSFYTWTFNFFLSAFLLLFVFGILAIKVEALLSGSSQLSDYVLIIFMILLLFPLGLLILIYPFVTKVVVKGNGLEYRGLTYILTADWKDLINIGYVENTPAGKTLVVISQGGKLVIRNWAIPFQEILVKKPQDIRILVSQFGSANGHSFETDILANVAQGSEFSNELEPL